MTKDEIAKALQQKREQLDAYTYDPELHSKEGLTLRYDVFRAYVAFFSFLKWGYMTPIFLVSLTSEHWEKLLLKADYDTTDETLCKDMGGNEGMQYYVAQRFARLFVVVAFCLFIYLMRSLPLFFVCFGWCSFVQTRV